MDYTDEIKREFSLEVGIVVVLYSLLGAYVMAYSHLVNFDIIRSITYLLLKLHLPRPCSNFVDNENTIKP